MKKKVCSCDGCKCKRARATTKFCVVDDVVQFVLKGDFYDEIEELIRAQTTIDLFNDQEIWSYILLEGETRAFKNLSESGKDILREYKTLILQLIERREHSDELSVIFRELEADDEDCTNFITFLNRTDIEDGEMILTILSIQEFIFETEISERQVAGLKKRVKELCEIIPESMQNLKEPPVTMIPMDELQKALDSYIAMREALKEIRP